MLSQGQPTDDTHEIDHRTNFSSGQNDNKNKHPIGNDSMLCIGDNVDHKPAVCNKTSTRLRYSYDNVAKSAIKYLDKDNDLSDILKNYGLGELISETLSREDKPINNVCNNSKFCKEDKGNNKSVCDRINDSGICSNSTIKPLFVSDDNSNCPQANWSNICCGTKLTLEDQETNYDDQLAKGVLLCF